ncbi:MAG: heme/hemin ABC transporter substrate-binding protein, partial [Anaerolineales bacterium]
SMRPDLVLASGDAGPESVLKQIQGAGVAVTVLDNGHSFESLRANMRIIGATLDPGAGAEALGGSRLEEDWAKTLAAVRAYRTQPRVAFILAHAGTGMLVAGEGTAANAMIRLAGAANALTGFGGYKPLTAEAIIGAQPEVLLITEQGLAAVGGPETLWQAPGLGLTPAAAARKLVAMEALYLLGFGPRLPQAVRELAERLRGSSSEIPSIFRVGPRGVTTTRISLW